MSRQQQVMWGIVIIVIIVGVVWWLASSGSGAPANQTPFGTTSAATDTQQAAATSAPMTANVVYNGSSFSPANVTIAQGGTVTWTSTDGNLWIASDPHPLHNGYDGTTMQQHCAAGYAGAAPFDECSAGTTWSFTFDKTGTWGYHDHLNAQVGGSVTVVVQQ